MLSRSCRMLVAQFFLELTQKYPFIWHFMSQFSESCQRVIHALLSPNQWSVFLSRSGNIFCLQKTAFVVSCSKSGGDICTTLTGYKYIY